MRNGGILPASIEYDVKRLRFSGIMPAAQLIYSTSIIWSKNMKKIIFSFLTLVFSLAIFSNAAFAQKEKPGMDKKMSDMSMEEMHKSPQHMLMTGYKGSFQSFAKALRHAAEMSDSLDPQLARTLVTELRRTADIMKAIHIDHMSKMTPEMRTKMSDMMDKMNQREAAKEEHLKALEALVAADSLNKAGIAEHAKELIGDHGKMETKEKHKLKDLDGLKEKMN